MPGDSSGALGFFWTVGLILLEAKELRPRGIPGALCRVPSTHHGRGQVSPAPRVLESAAGLAACASA